ncbi:hypothetical protein OC835_003747 [Tilletia horrida]|nr:hypothetical protein OC835_003747 [Tilletia horrida]
MLAASLLAISSFATVQAINHQWLNSCTTIANKDCPRTSPRFNGAGWTYSFTTCMSTYWAESSTGADCIGTPFELTTNLSQCYCYVGCMKDYNDATICKNDCTTAYTGRPAKC